jgi:ribosomal protein L37AE/L43A
LSNALMYQRKDKYLLQCPECGSRAFEIQGPLIESGIVQCVACHAEICPVDEFLAAAEALLESAEQELRKRRFN